MDRRELLRLITILTGGALIGGDVMLTGCNNPDKVIGSGTFTPDDIAFLDEVAETILPKTNTPGAKDARIGNHMVTMVNDCYTTDQQKVFHDGIKQLDDACKAMHNKGFMSASPEERRQLLTQLDADARKDMTIKTEFDNQQVEKEREEIIKGNPSFVREERTAHYFSMMKQLTIVGYFTSKEGRTGALNYTPVPGKYDGNVTYKKGDKLNAGMI